MKTGIMTFITAFILLGMTVFANDVSIDDNGNVTTGASALGNLEVTGASGERAIYGIAADTGGVGVYGENTTLGNTNYGILGHLSYGVYGQSASGYGVYGVSTSSIGVFGYSANNFAVYGNSDTGWAGYFNGDVMVIGNMTIGGTLTGYSETDPLFSAWDRSSGISIIESQITDLNHFTNANEIDPVFSAWDKSTGITITESQVTDLDKYSRVEVDTMIAALDARITALENQRHWSVPIFLEVSAIAADSPQVAVDGSGNAVAVWAQSGNIYTSRYVVGTGWNAPILIEYNTGNAAAPQVGVDGSGNAVAVWHQYDGAYNSIYANRYVTGTGWDTSIEIEYNNSGQTSFPHVAVHGSGAFAVWDHSIGIYANRYIVGTGWSAETQISGSPFDVAPQVAVDGNGNAIVVWEDNGNIYANRYIAGTGWDTEVLIKSGTGTAAAPQVAVDGSGNAVAVWQQYDGAYNSIYANRYVTGTGWDTAVLIESDTGTASSPQVAVHGSGDAIAVWIQNGNVYANHYW